VLHDPRGDAVLRFAPRPDLRHARGAGARGAVGQADAGDRAVAMRSPKGETTRKFPTRAPGQRLLQLPAVGQSGLWSPDNTASTRPRSRRAPAPCGAGGGHLRNRVRALQGEGGSVLNGPPSAATGRLDPGDGLARARVAADRHRSDRAPKSSPWGQRDPPRVRMERTADERRSTHAGILLWNQSPVPSDIELRKPQGRAEAMSWVRDNILAAPPRQSGRQLDRQTSRSIPDHRPGRGSSSSGRASRQAADTITHTAVEIAIRPKHPVPALGHLVACSAQLATRLVHRAAGQFDRPFGDFEPTCS